MNKKMPIYALLVSCLVFFVPAVAFAQDTFGIETAGQGSLLGGEDLILTITRIISVALIFLGILAVGIVLYAGFLYMTAGGNEDQVDRAKKMLINGAIGLAIILSSYAIARFVIDRLSLATGAGSGGVSINCQDPAYAAANPRRCAPGDFSCAANRTCCTAEQFVVLSMTPAGGPGPGTPTGMNNIRPRVVFSQSVASDIPADQVFSIERGGSDVSNDFSFSYVNADRRVVEAVPTGGPLAPSGNYLVTILEGLRAVGGEPLEENVSCGFFPQTASFSVDTAGVTDSVRPVPRALTINGSPAADIMLPRGRTYDIASAITDSNGVGYAHLLIIRESDNTTVASYDGPPVERGSAAPGGNPYAYLYTLIIPSNAPTLERYRVVLTVFDIDNNQASVETTYVVLGEHCDNNVQDGDETDIDFGGSCRGNGACTADWQCISSRCDETTGQCIAAPIILDISPWDGAGGNWVSVIGRYFGEDIGDVAFGFDRDRDGAIETAEWVTTALAACGAEDVWHDQYVIAEVPPSDVALPPGTRAGLRIVRGDDPTLFDATIDDIGPISGPDGGYFTKNSTQRPGLCALIPRAGIPETDITVRGNGLGATQSGSDILFGGVEARATAWSDAVIETAVPRNMSAGRVAVSALVGGEPSNGIPFEVQDEGADLLPLVESIDPGSATRRSFVTIYGRRFGETTGRIFFANSGATCPGDSSCLLVSPVDEPLCGDTWTGTQIVIEVPNAATIATHAVIVETAGGYQSDGDAALTVLSGAPLPSICRLTPDAGPSPLPGGESVVLTGRNFTNTTNAYFWTVGSDPNDLTTWLLAAGPQSSSGPIFERNVAGDTDTIRTLLPVSNNGYSMETGPIRVRSAAGTSNSVRYTVTDCREASPDSSPGFQCCQSTGQWRDDQFVCPGETREAGYGYRFTTGRIPRLPFVVEDCPAPPPGPGPVAFPSPTPWQEWERGRTACVNATVAVRFSMGMNDATLVPNNLRLFTCGQSEQPDCDNAVDISTELRPVYANGALYLRQTPPDLLGDTWYRLVLLDGIESQQVVRVLGVDRIMNEPLLVTRPCGTFDRRESAYCFEFKTGNAGTRCALAGVAITPPLYSVAALGPLLDPRYPAGNTVPFYYYLWGRGSQECTVIPVDGLGWQWSSANASQAAAVLAPGQGFTDTRATGNALAPTAPTSVEIRADAQVDSQDYRGISLLTIDIGDPEVIEFWPNCQEACVNATVGVRFNRPMYVPDLSSNIRLYACPDEICFPHGAVGDPRARPVPLTVTTANTLVLEASPQSQLAENTWYQLEVVGQVRAIGGFDANNNPIPGPVLTPFFSKFRTKADSAFCTASRVVVAPDPFVAYSIGEKTVYTALPLGSPDACSALGQRLSAWDFGWGWSTGDPAVASVSQFSFYGRPKSYCTTGCLVQGSDVTNDPVARAAFGGLCGNGAVDPGEDCDINGEVSTGTNEIPGVSCNYSCLRPGASNVTCGNGTIEALSGEECDTADSATQDFCATACTWRGSSSDLLPPGDVTSPRCGSGQATNGEDCEVGVDGETSATCSAQCLHAGTPMAQSWCDVFASPQTADVCVSAISMCGNSIVEGDEECEIVSGVVEVMVPIANPGSPQTFVQQATNAPVDRCSDRCILSGNICATNIASPLRCAAGSEGCTAGCTLAGASVGWSASSLCGDGVSGTGEFSWCEYTADEVNVGNISGQNPTQAVTAAGQGTVDPQTRQQTTDVRSSAVAERRDNAAPAAIANPPEGSGDYALQCGYTEYAEPQNGFLNDCDNPSQGVGTNSCCYPRAMRIASYPEDGAGLPGGPSGDVCRNTLISLTFDRAIDEAAIIGNLFVAEGHDDAGYDCASGGEREVTTDVEGTLAAEAQRNGGFFARVWSALKRFVLHLFGNEVNASSYSAAAIDVWCTGSVRAAPELRYEDVLVGGVMETHTIVELPITQLLLENTIYAVYIRGGGTGVKDLRGVPILDDSILFETGDDICKLNAVVVEPSAAFYGAPNTPQDFAAIASSTNDQAIVPIPNVYDWDWSWGPAAHPVFDVPADMDTAVTVGSRAVEGAMTLVASATVTADADRMDNQEGRTFSGNAQLTALFCENPWPLRDYYPYEDGNPPGRQVNNDGYLDGFTGGELPPVIVGGSRVYFNFSMGYCADAGESGDLLDDLPYLEPIVSGNLAGETRRVQPRRIGRFSHADIQRGADVAAFGDYVFETGNLSDAVVSIDVSNPASPQRAATIRHDPSRGIYLDNANEVDLVRHPNGRPYLFVLAGGTQPAITVIDASRPAAPTHTSSFLTPPTPTGSRYVPLGIAFSADGRRAYLGFRDTTGPSGNIYRHDALAIFNIENPANLRLLAMVTRDDITTRYGRGSAVSSPSALAIVGEYLYVGTSQVGGNYPVIYRIAGDRFEWVNYGNPSTLGSFTTEVQRMIYDPTLDRLYMLSLRNGVGVLDVSNPALPVTVGSYPPFTRAGGSFNAVDMDVENGLTTLVSNEREDVWDPMLRQFTPRIVGNRFDLIDLSDPARPLYLGRSAAGLPAGNPTGVDIDGMSAYVSIYAPNDGMEIYDLSLGGGGGAGGTTISGALKQFLFVNEQNDDAIGVQIFDNTSPPRTSAAPEFTRIAQAGLTVIRPNGTDEWFEGQQRTINWSGGDPSWLLTVSLIDITNNQVEATLAPNTPNDGFASVSVPTVTPADRSGSPYNIYIVCAQNCPQGQPPSAYGSNFVIFPRVRVTTPTRGVTLNAGSPYDVEWSGGKNGWGMELRLFSVAEGRVVHVFPVSGRNDGQEQVTIPADTLSGQYRITVTCENDVDCQPGGVQAYEFDDSEEFTISGVAPPEPPPEEEVEVPPPAGIGPPSGRDDVRFSSREWYERKFGPVPARFRSVTVDGYDALTDGNTYYVHALNIGANNEVFNNIFVLSINPDAQGATRNVFDELLNSLRFNINVTDFGYCSVGNGSTPQDMDLPDNDPSIACTTDFDCSDVEGSVRICANARTKLQRDVDRLQDIRQAQKNIANYHTQTASYPALRSGTFIPGYTISRWPSWGRLGAVVGALPTDPVNEWSACGSNDAQTCWDAVRSEFLCPDRSQVYEYRTVGDGSDYVLYSALEYLDGQSGIVGDLIDRSHFADVQYCTPATRYSPFAASCGDSVVNAANGEACDPPGALGTSTEGIRSDGSQGTCPADQRASAQCSASCVITYGRCESGCGNGVLETDLGERCDDGALNGDYGRCNDTCSGPSARYCGNTSARIGRPPSAEAPDEFCEKGDDIYDTLGFCLKESCRSGARYGFTSAMPSIDLDPSPPGDETGNIGITAMHVMNTTTGWAVGVYTPSFGSQRTTESVILRLNSNGDGWNVLYPAPPNGSVSLQGNLQDIFFINSSRGWIAGSGAGFAASATILRTQDGGVTWTPGIIAGSNPFIGTFEGIWFVDQNIGYAVGSAARFTRTTDGGANWSAPIAAYTNTNVTLYDVHFVNRNDGWAVGGDNRFNAPPRGTIVYTADGGNSWTAQESGLSTVLRDVHFLNLDIGWAVGTDDMILWTADGGDNWIPSPIGNANLGFSSVAFLNRDIGFISGLNSEIYRTMDGGLSWQRLTDVGTTGSQQWFTDIAAVSTLRLWVAGGSQGNRIYRMDLDSYCAADTLSPTHVTDCDANADCRYGDACAAVIDTVYHARDPRSASVSQGSSCAIDCRAPGGYCGDGITQPAYEECDDGNASDTDSCTTFCFSRTPATGLAPRTGSCGDGAVETGEACDLGADNGIACTTEYGRSCTYCSEFCTQVLTVDPVDYCGNGVVDQTGTDVRGNVTYEVCDTMSDGTVVSTTASRANVCSDRGSYQCLNSCTQFVDGCISCGFKNLGRGGTSPFLAVLNPMVGNAPATGGHTSWATSYLSVRLFTGSAPPPFNNFAVSLGANYRTQQRILDASRETGGIETNIACSPYSVRFNHDLPEALGDFFPYPVANDVGTVSNELLVSPAMPGRPDGTDLGLFRIVVRWSDDENLRGAQFSGMLYNEVFNGIGAASVVGYARATGDVQSGTDLICENMREQQSTLGFYYWWPDGCPGNSGNGYENSVYVHPIGGLTRTFAQAMTLTAGSGSVGAANADGNNTRNTNYAFFVDAIGEPMGRYRNSNLTVEVYGYHEGQDAIGRNTRATLNDYYAPIARFEIQQVAQTSVSPETDEYWHVFNIVRNAQTDGTYRYEIDRFGPGSDGGHGTIESGFQDVLQNLPGAFVSEQPPPPPPPPAPPPPAAPPGPPPPAPSCQPDGGPCTSPSDCCAQGSFCSSGRCGSV